MLPNIFSLRPPFQNPVRIFWSPKKKKNSLNFLQYDLVKLPTGGHQLKVIKMSAYDLTYLLPANKVWGKVIFLHVCVILFTGLIWLKYLKRENAIVKLFSCCATNTMEMKAPKNEHFLGMSKIKIFIWWTDYKQPSFSQITQLTMVTYLTYLSTLCFNMEYCQLCMGCMNLLIIMYNYYPVYYGLVPSIFLITMI